MTRAATDAEQAVPALASGIVAAAVAAVLFAGAPLEPSLAIAAVSIAGLLYWRSRRRDRRSPARDRGSAEVRSVPRPALPEDPGPGEYQCQECGSCVTVGPSGTEYGHAAGVVEPASERCPRRPTSVDPHPTDGGDAS